MTSNILIEIQRGLYDIKAPYGIFDLVTQLHIRHCEDKKMIYNDFSRKITLIRGHHQQSMDRIRKNHQQVDEITQLVDEQKREYDNLQQELNAKCQELDREIARKLTMFD